MRAGERFKSGLKLAVRGIVAGPPRARAGCSILLTYHSVGTRDHETNVGPAAFEEQMKWLADSMRVVPLAEAVERADGVALTFDDGYRDNYIEAAPVLARLGLPATVFVVTGRLGAWLDHDVRAAESRLMSWEDLRALAGAGWTIGGHTLSHPILTRLSEADQRREISCCKAQIEERLGLCAEAFAYPFGSALDFSEVTRAIVRECGYTCAVSNRYGVNGPGADRWALRRVWVDRTDTLDSFRAKVEGRLDRLAWLDNAIGIRARRIVNQLLRAG
jgi:peptidoglycan/xylan/chitin deacetylase (PgdA/CDA1 family)